MRFPASLPKNAAPLLAWLRRPVSPPAPLLALARRPTNPATPGNQGPARLRAWLTVPALTRRTGSPDAHGNEGLARPGLAAGLHGRAPSKLSKPRRPLPGWLVAMASGPVMLPHSQRILLAPAPLPSPGQAGLPRADRDAAIRAPGNPARRLMPPGAPAATTGPKTAPRPPRRGQDRDLAPC